MTGATGMVGTSVLAALLSEKTAREVLSLGRRPSGIDHPRLIDARITAFGETQSIEPYVNGIDNVFHCLATYSTRVSRLEYEEITVDWLRAILAACGRSVRSDRQRNWSGTWFDIFFGRRFRK
nr:NAD-dependent epimerase/dehydratase family protein [Ruegeria arenilitoris]